MALLSCPVSLFWEGRRRFPSFSKQIFTIIFIDVSRKVMSFDRNLNKKTIHVDDAPY